MTDPLPQPQLLADRKRLWAFWLGSFAVVAGVLMHLPMFWMGRHTNWQMVGMPMDAEMIWGMGLIFAGVAVAAWGLFPKNAPNEAVNERFTLTPPEDAPLNKAHWELMAVLVIALVIDIMKPASLGFIMPGTMAEYGLTKSEAAWVPFAALCGTVTGSIVWGVLADIFGRRAAILLSAVMFIGTSICGAMPDFWWNAGMCWLMGASAGGLLPVAYALLAESMPTRHRGWSLVLVGGLGAVGGYLAASYFSALLQPLFGWRVMWFLNLPTGLILLLLNNRIPESARFLLATGRRAAAHAIMLRFGAKLRKHDDAAEMPVPHDIALPHAPRSYRGLTVALTVSGLAYGLINFGLLLWLPAALVAKGQSVEASSALIAKSALIAFPTVLLAAGLYHRLDGARALAAMTAVTILGILGVVWMETGAGLDPVLPLALLIVGSNGLLACLLPYTAESYPLRIRGRASGWVAGCTKFGGLIAQGLGILAAVPALGAAAWFVLIPTALSLVLVARYRATPHPDTLAVG